MTAPLSTEDAYDTGGTLFFKGAGWPADDNSFYVAITTRKRPTAWANVRARHYQRGLSVNTEPSCNGPQEDHSSYYGPVKTLCLVATVLIASPAFRCAERGTPPPPPAATPPTGPAQASDAAASRSMGRPDAPVTVYEMADFQCPACRMFAVTVLPTLEREYIETGKVRWVFVNLPLTSIHPNAVAAAEVAMCAARQGRFWEMHDALYKQQDDWAKLPQPRSTLITLAQRAGADRAKLVACLEEGGARREVELDAQRAARTGAHATPSFYIEGGLIEGAPYTPDPMRRVLDSVYTVRTRPSK